MESILHQYVTVLIKKWLVLVGQEKRRAYFVTAIFLVFVQLVPHPFVELLLIFQFRANVEQLSNVLLLPLEWFCMGPLQQWLSVGRRQSPKDVCHPPHLQGARLRYEILDTNVELFTSQFASLLARVNNLPMPLSKAPQIITTMREWIERYERNGGGPIQLSCSTIQISPDVNSLFNLFISTSITNKTHYLMFQASNILLKNSKFNSETMQTDGKPQHFLYPLQNINCSPSILSSQGLSGNKESDLTILNKEAIEFLPIVNFYWGIWSLLCDQEHNEQQKICYIMHFQELQAPEVAFDVNACDRIILYFSLKSDMRI
uniref:Transmembrane protein 231 n=1 Tax=Heterorhabditis bacteriophora TaxID=37862 RepID=A0A1I7WLP5_HETBA